MDRPTKQSLYSNLILDLVQANVCSLLYSFRCSAADSRLGKSTAREPFAGEALEMDGIVFGVHGFWTMVLG
jgi:hypothetical protein